MTSSEEAAAQIRVVRVVQGILEHPKARKLILFAARIADPAADAPGMDDVEMELGTILGEWLSR